MDNKWDDDTAQWYLEKYSDHALNRLWLNHVNFPPNAHLLDIGCGGGASLKAALLKLTEGRATGVDPSPVMAAAARHNLPGLDIYQAGAEEIPLPGAVVDVVLANCSLIHWQNLEAGLSEVMRVLKPGGQFLTIEEAFAEQEEDGRLKSPKDLPDHLIQSGFTVLEHGHHNTNGESYWAALAQKSI